MSNLCAKDVDVLMQGHKWNKPVFQSLQAVAQAIHAGYIVQEGIALDVAVDAALEGQPLVFDEKLWLVKHVDFFNQ